jgi:hypothetical protein
MSDDACTVRFVTDNASGRGVNTHLWVDGHDLSRWCRGVTLSSAVGETNTITLDLIPRDGFAFDLPVALLHLTIVPPPGYRLVQETRGARVYFWTEPQTDDEALG